MPKLSDQSARILLESMHAREQACAAMQSIALNMEEFRRLREVAVATRALSALLRFEYREVQRQAALFRAVAMPSRPTQIRTMLKEMNAAAKR